MISKRMVIVFQINQNEGYSTVTLHKKSFWPVTPPVIGQSPGRVARGQRFMCYPRNPRSINHVSGSLTGEERLPG